jgi:ribosomal protein L12E/L44/L45/RPP1/RPP2
LNVPIYLLKLFKIISDHSNQLSMSLPAISSLTGAAKDTLAVTLALLILSEEGGSTAASSVQRIVEAAGVKAHPSVAEAFERNLQGKAVKSFLAVGGGSSAAAAPAPAAVEAKPAQKEEKKRMALFPLCQPLNSWFDASGI